MTTDQKKLLEAEAKCAQTQRLEAVIIHILPQFERANLMSLCDTLNKHHEDSSQIAKKKDYCNCPYNLPYGYDYYCSCETRILDYARTNKLELY